MEYCQGGDLKRSIFQQPKKIYDLKTAIKVMADVIRGLEMIHSKGFIHRDIKPENILVKI